MKTQFAAVAAAMTMAGVVHAQDGSYSVYGGVDYVQHSISVTRNVAAPPSGSGTTLPGRERLDGDGSNLRLRAGMWLGEDFSIEAQGSVVSEEVNGADETGEIDAYYGIFINARAQPFEWMDVLFPVGFAKVDASVPATDSSGNPTTVSTSNDGIAYGVNFQIRLGSWLGDEDSIISGLGVGAGFMVYNSSGNVNVNGYNAGLHFGYDF